MEAVREEEMNLRGYTPCCLCLVVASVWSPHRVGQVNRVESVQRKFTKRLPGYDSVDYKSDIPCAASPADDATSKA